MYKRVFCNYSAVVEWGEIENFARRKEKWIRYELSLDYENEIEKMLSMLDMESIEKALIKGKSTVK